MSEREQVEEIPGLTHERSAQGDRLSWPNRSIPKSTGLVLVYAAGLLAAITLGLFLSAGLIQDLMLWRQGAPSGMGTLFMSALIMLTCWGVALVLGASVLRLAWTETVWITSEGIQVDFEGPLAPKGRRIPADEIWRISYEKIQNRRDRESRYSVNVFYQDGRESLAFWMRRQDKHYFYLLLKQAVLNQGWPYVDFRSSERPGQAGHDFS